MVTCLLGEDETTVNKVRSILAHLEYTHQIRKWNDSGVPFRTYIYVPEVHPLLGTEFHEREDEGHVFKVININLCAYCRRHIIILILPHS